MTLTKHSIDTLQMLIESNQVSILRSKILEDTNSLTQAVFQIEYFFNTSKSKWYVHNCSKIDKF